MKFIFLILHYGDPTITKRCVQSIYEIETDGEKEIVVVDNDPSSRYVPGDVPEMLDEMTTSGSNAANCSYQDNNPLDNQMTEKQSTELHILKMEESHGFSNANNRGYDWIKEHEDLQNSVLIAANNDIVFCQKEFCNVLQGILQQENCPDILGPDIVDYDTGYHQNPMAHHCPTPQEARRTIVLNRVSLYLLPIAFPLVNHMLKKMEDHQSQKMAVTLERSRRNTTSKQPQEIKASLNLDGEEKKDTSKGTLPDDESSDIVLCGACLIFSAGFMTKEQNLFRPETEFYYEEYILSQRAQRSGYTIGYNTDLNVLHQSGTATHARFQNRRKYVAEKLRRTADACEIYLRDMRKFT